MKPFRRGLAAAVLGFVLVFPSACSNPPKTGSPDTPAAQAPQPRSAPTTPAESDPSLLAFDEPPTALKRTTPKMPEGPDHEGKVSVEVSVDVNGMVTDARVLDEQSSASPAMQAAALEAAKEWVFSPAKRKGKPVPSTIVIPFRFTRD